MKPALFAEDEEPHLYHVKSTYKGTPVWIALRDKERVGAYYDMHAGVTFDLTEEQAHKAISLMEHEFKTWARSKADYGPFRIERIT